MKKIFAIMTLLLLAALCAVGVSAASSTVWNGTAATSFAGGTGTEADPYQIATAEQLAYLAQKVNGGEPYEGKYFTLTADIVLNDTTSEYWTASAQQWTPIGTEEAPFMGNFDGRNHTISGICIFANANYQGLFGYVVGADINYNQIANLTIGTGDITAVSYVGGVVGWSQYTMFENCHNYATILADGTYCGGIVGCAKTTNTEYAGNLVLFKECYNHGDISKSGQISGLLGGIAGWVSSSSYGSVTVQNCHNKGAIQGGDGILGSRGSFAAFDSASFFFFKNCSNTGDITSGSGLTGGSVNGSDYDSNTDACYEIVNCYNTGTILYGCGLVKNIGSFSITTIDGIQINVESKITNCYNTGNVTGHGIVAYAKNAIIENCYNTGEVSGAGIAGILENSTMRYCYNTGKITNGSGIVQGLRHSTLEHCYNTGNCSITYSGYEGCNCGGIAGWAAYSTMKNCFNSGTINFLSRSSPEWTSSETVGGIVGKISSGNTFVESYIENCYNIGKIVGASSYYAPKGHYVETGSIAGKSTTTAIKNCYYLQNSAIDSDNMIQTGVGHEADAPVPADITGQTTALSLNEMKAAANFVGFDFTSAWTMTGNSAYPYPELISPLLTDAPTISLPQMLTGIVQPAPITGIAYGTSWGNSGITGATILSMLPTTVTLNLSDSSTLTADVSWICNDYVQSPADKATHTYTAVGTFALPAGVGNPDNLPLTVNVNFTVEGYGVTVTGIVSGFGSASEVTTVSFISTNGTTPGVGTLPGIGMTPYTAAVYGTSGTFTLTGVTPGTYTLRVSKSGHLTYTITDFVVGTTDIDLTQHADPNIATITLRCGDLNGDGIINTLDIAIIRAVENYMQSVSDCTFSFGG